MYFIISQNEMLNGLCKVILMSTLDKVLWRLEKIVPELSLNTPPLQVLRVWIL